MQMSNNRRISKRRIHNRNKELKHAKVRLCGGEGEEKLIELLLDCKDGQISRSKASTATLIYKFWNL